MNKVKKSSPAADDITKTTSFNPSHRSEAITENYSGSSSKTVLTSKSSRSQSESGITSLSSSTNDPLSTSTALNTLSNVNLINTDNTNSDESGIDYVKEEIEPYLNKVILPREEKESINI